MKGLVSLTILFFVLSGCSSGVVEDFDISPRPAEGLTFTYFVKGESIRQMAGNPEEMMQEYTFQIKFLQPENGSFPAWITFDNIAYDTPEDDLYEDIFQGALVSLQNDSTLYILQSDGTILYQSNGEGQLRPEMDFENPDNYLKATTAYLKENFLANLFVEWIDYVPNGPINKESTWTSISDLSLMGLTEVERKFEWSVEKITAKSIHIIGNSVIRSFDFDLEMGPELSMPLTYDGTLTSTYRYELDREYFLIKNAHIQLVTDGRVINREEIPNMESLNEPLTGEANTFISRK